MERISLDPRSFRMNRNLTRASLFFAALFAMNTELLAQCNWSGVTEACGTVGIGTNSPAPGVAGDITAPTLGGNLAAKYQDVAEWVPSAGDYEPGTVVVLDRERTNHVTISTTSFDTAVAGVISPRPGLLLGERGDGKSAVATTGRVHVKVDASKKPIHIGDLLVTSDRPGYAMLSDPIEIGGRRMHQPGTIIGKALEPLAQGQGEILVLLSLQ